MSTTTRIDDELHEEFHRIAEERWSKLVATGKSVAWDDARAYLEGRARGERPRKPAAREFGRGVFD